MGYSAYQHQYTPWYNGVKGSLLEQMETDITEMRKAQPKPPWLEHMAMKTRLQVVELLVWRCLCVRP